MNALRCPARLPLFEEGVLLLDRGEASAFERRVLGMLNGVLDAAFAIRIPDPRGVGHDAVMREHGRVDRVELRLVQVGFDDPFLQVVEYHVLAAAAEIPPGLLVQSGPGFLAGLPDHPPKATPGIAQGHDKQTRPAIALGTGVKRQRPFAIVDLRLFAGGEFQSIKLGRLVCDQRAGKALDAVIAGRKPELIDEVLVDRREVAAKL